MSEQDRCASPLVVVKIGSSTLQTREGTLDVDYILELCSQVGELRALGHSVIIVTSGAVAAGRERLGIRQRPDDIETLQACAACGQAALTETYATALAELGITCAQVLLTRRDVVEREGYLNARNTLTRLLELGVVPVVNENDTVSVAEFAFGDNDMLGAIVSALTKAGLYVILSDVEGLYTADPTKDESATLIEHVEAVDSNVTQMATGSTSSVGTGGMASKIRAARAMLAAGIPMVVCHGRREHVLLDVVEGREVGTRFENTTSLPTGHGRKLWIGLAEMPQGTVTVDAGAAKAMREAGASLLPVGVKDVTGTFDQGDVICILDDKGTEVARGVTRYSVEDLVLAAGFKLDVVGHFMPEYAGCPVVHRDEMLVF